MVKHWNRLPKGVVNVPKLSVPKRGIWTMPLMIKMTATILVSHEVVRQMDQVMAAGPFSKWNILFHMDNKKYYPTVHAKVQHQHLATHLIPKEPLIQCSMLHESKINEVKLICAMILQFHWQWFLVVFSSYNVLTAIFHCVFLLTHRKHLQSGVLEHQVGDF